MTSPRQTMILGSELAYTTAGTGPAVLLVHGLGGDRRTWRHLIGPLAAGHTVIAVDLPGHGQSGAPAGDFSLGAHATALRDLLITLGHGSATVVGHSLGGGIALQFAYQFPERTDRLVLISSGGLGPEVTPVLRAATLPGAEVVVAGMALLPRWLTRRVVPVLSLLPGVAARQDAGPLAEGLHQLLGATHRRAFIRTARSVLGWRGQAVSATSHLQLLADLPVMVAWGDHDATIPPRHHQAVADLLANPTVVEITGAGHYPHETAVDQILPALLAFLAGSTAFRYSEDRWRHLLARSPLT
ncbi:alpha/beta fold hydrolase [Actinoplanes hulinensis]|uniref:Alpha/beta fold hydrolase n=1 Tax=Actinoplanes hulinensis TaxID=1144547 RepID=A0ABS7BFB9_9ACTN|nr:alpha/beta fold hydrolase [Actinoplanes hulinensis]MBW6439554.1 alpha/beta fold hydrolase [Actinoplanes hulinensis]